MMPDASPRCTTQYSSDLTAREGDCCQPRQVVRRLSRMRPPRAPPVRGAPFSRCAGYCQVVNRTPLYNAPNSTYRILGSGVCGQISAKVSARRALGPIPETRQVVPAAPLRRSASNSELPDIQTTLGKGSWFSGIHVYSTMMRYYYRPGARPGSIHPPAEVLLASTLAFCQEPRVSRYFSEVRASLQHNLASHREIHHNGSTSHSRSQRSIAPLEL